MLFIGGGQDVSALDCKFIEEAKKNNDLICSPIYEWTDIDVWDFIRGRNMDYNPLYDKGFTRVGCIGCPLSTEQVKELEMYPKYKENYIKAFDRMLKKRRSVGKDDITGKVSLHRWMDGEAVYRWWINDQTVPGQINIEEYLNDKLNRP